VLLAFGILILLASLANATGWQVVRSFRFCGICTLLLSFTFFLLTGMELLKNPRQKRTIVAALLFLAATALCFTGSHFEIIRIP
jgi:uncharacterized membrane protein